MQTPYTDIHTHRPTGRHIELRTAGIHPWDAAREEVAELLLRLDRTTELCARGVQAIGEIGLDNACGVDPAVQEEVFRAQLRIAAERGLPVVVHSVRAFEQTMRTLKAYRLRAVIFHGFIGSPEQALRALGQGYDLSFGMRTFSSPKTLAALRATPLRQLFVETDQDDVSIEEVYAQIAEARGVTEEELRRATLENYERIFSPTGKSLSEAGQAAVE